MGEGAGASLGRKFVAERGGGVGIVSECSLGRYCFDSGVKFVKLKTVLKRICSSRPKFIDARLFIYL